ncbi:hypothetical protein LA080_003589 [Diaporthe eres]|nr:hypothetical protein LA080_003589 [Diaporthe eres]
MNNNFGAAFRGVLKAPDIAGHAHSKFMLLPHTVNRFTAPHLSCLTAAPAAAVIRRAGSGCSGFGAHLSGPSRKRTVYALHGCVLSLGDDNTHGHLLVTLCRFLMPVQPSQQGSPVVWAHPSNAPATFRPSLDEQPDSTDPGKLRNLLGPQAVKETWQP